MSDNKTITCESFGCTLDDYSGKILTFNRVQLLDSEIYEFVNQTDDWLSVSWQLSSYQYYPDIIDKVLHLTLAQSNEATSGAILADRQSLSWWRERPAVAHIAPQSHDTFLLTWAQTKLNYFQARQVNNLTWNYQWQLDVRSIDDPNQSAHPDEGDDSGNDNGNENNNDENQNSGDDNPGSEATQSGHLDDDNHHDQESTRSGELDNTDERGNSHDQQNSSDDNQSAPDNGQHQHTDNSNQTTDVADDSISQANQSEGLADTTAASSAPSTKEENLDSDHRSDQNTGAHTNSSHNSNTSNNNSSTTSTKNTETTNVVTTIHRQINEIVDHKNTASSIPNLTYVSRRASVADTDVGIDHSSVDHPSATPSAVINTAALVLPTPIPQVLGTNTGTRRRFWLWSWWWLLLLLFLMLLWYWWHRTRKQ